ncbi:MAG: radical SAM protein [Candidatus Sumerlaeota bacterium]|nr:radical SAM protein [Candidatus Sumerlaeota bacterium]
MDLSVISTYRCNSKCAMCYVWRNPSRREEEVTAETLSKLPGGFDNLNVTGGEPTLRADLPLLIDTLYPKARITEISTNGLRPQLLVPIVRKYPRVKIRFSLEGKDLLNDAIRGEKNGFATKIQGMQLLKQAGGKDLGFATVIQDENAHQLVELYDLRAYLTLGLIKPILGQDRLAPCTAGTDFAFIDPWADVWACNVRTDLRLGNLKRQSWEEIMAGEPARRALLKVAECTQNCWMVTTARAAMRSRLLPMLPKWKPLEWVIVNRIRVAMGMCVRFDDYIDYANVKPSPQVPRPSFLDRNVGAKVQTAADEHYVLKEFINR